MLVGPESTASLERDPGPGAERASKNGVSDAERRKLNRHQIGTRTAYLSRSGSLRRSPQRPTSAGPLVGMRRDRCSSVEPLATLGAVYFVARIRVERRTVRQRLTGGSTIGNARAFEALGAT